jgi:hypothetical protein
VQSLWNRTRYWAVTAFDCIERWKTSESVTKNSNHVGNPKLLYLGAQTESDRIDSWRCAVPIIVGSHQSTCIKILALKCSLQSARFKVPAEQIEMLLIGSGLRH